MILKRTFKTLSNMTLGLLFLSACSSLGIDRYASFMAQNIPEPYQGQSNPLVTSIQNRVEGYELFRDHCSVCHGIKGKGDGELSAELIPKPANLTFTKKLPIATDAFYLWTISEGGERFDTAMPSFSGSLRRTRHLENHSLCQK